MIVKQVLTLTTDGSGDATGFTDILNGKLLSIMYEKTDYANGVDFTITEENTGRSLWTEANVNAAKTCAPRDPIVGSDGAASLYATGGAAVIGGDIGIADSRIKVVVAQGGATKVGKFTFILEQ